MEYKILLDLYNIVDYNNFTILINKKIKTHGGQNEKINELVKK